jgi:hypothetical protein
MNSNSVISFENVYGYLGVLEDIKYHINLQKVNGFWLDIGKETLPIHPDPNILGSKVIFLIMTAFKFNLFVTI